MLRSSLLRDRKHHVNYFRSEYPSTRDKKNKHGGNSSIKSNLTCETKNLIYMIQCNRCNLQYRGETKRRLKDRFNEHRRTIDNPNTKSKPTTAALRTLPHRS